MTPRPRRTRPTPSSFDECPELVPLVTARRIGLSFDELNMMSTSDYLDFVELWLDCEGDAAGDGEDDVTRAATQGDIDVFFSRH